MCMHQHVLARGLLALAIAPVMLASLSGCTLHRNILLRYHLEFDCDNLCDDEVPATADRCRCDKCSKLGRPHHQHAPQAKTPAQTGHARFHPLPSKPVFPAPNGEDMNDMGPPAPQWYLRQHEPLQEKGRIRAEPSVPAPDLEEVDALPPMPNSG
jgi:hypothetical protein